MKLQLRQRWPLYLALFGCWASGVLTQTPASTVHLIGKEAGASAINQRFSPYTIALICIGTFIALMLGLRYIINRYQLTLKGKMLILLSGVFSLFLVYSLLSYFSIYNLRAISNEMEEINDTKYPIIAYISQITEHQTQQQIYFERFLRTRLADDRETFLSFNKRIKDVIAGAEAHIVEAYEKALSSSDRSFLQKLTSDIAAIKGKHQHYVDSCEQQLAQYTTTTHIDLSEIKTTFEKCNTPGEELANAVNEFLTTIEQDVADATHQVLASEKYTIDIIIDIALFSMAWGIFVLLSIWRSSSLIIRQINATISSLHRSSQEVQKASDNLNASSSTLEEVANKQTATVSEATVSVTSNEEIMKKNLQRVIHSNELSHKISSIAIKAESSMKSLVESMQKISESNERIQQLAAIIEDISSKTKIIDEIVFQTKLISFNTAVEAERAGEHGRGFAVIAQEVGKLAAMSGAASKEISQMVARTKDAAQVIAKENRERVVTGSKLVQETGSILKEISESSHSVIDSAEQIMQSSQEQHVAISQLNQSLMQIDKTTHLNLAMAKKTALASTQLNQQSKSLSAIVKELMKVIFSSQPSPESKDLAETLPKEDPSTDK